ncbi:MAG TPA: hypothetical protein VFS02_24900, partial [Telluria sp.]|nr:hypothetical protein [Telluria sp.]
MLGLFGILGHEEPSELAAASRLKVNAPLGGQVEKQSNWLGAGIGLLRHTFSSGSVWGCPPVVCHKAQCK